VEPVHGTVCRIDRLEDDAEFYSDSLERAYPILSAFYAIIFDAAEQERGPNYSDGLLW
jgi:hypothetical protein